MMCSLLFHDVVCVSQDIGIGVARHRCRCRKTLEQVSKTSVQVSQNVGASNVPCRCLWRGLGVPPVEILYRWRTGYALEGILMGVRRAVVLGDSHPEISFFGEKGEGVPCREENITF